jgi:hypothetical protein
LHDCATCTVKYPAKFDVDHQDELYGQVNGWATHLLVATGKSDWVRDVADEEGSVMEAIEKGGLEPSNGVRRVARQLGLFAACESPETKSHHLSRKAPANKEQSETQAISIEHARSRRIPHGRKRQTANNRPPPT